MSGCSECGRTPLEARGMCATHYKRAWRGPSTLWHRDELLAEVELMLADDCPERVAQRLGVTASAIERSAYRAGRTDLARVFGRLHHADRRTGQT